MEFNNIYYLKILKKSNPNLVGDETYEFKTVNQFKITGFEYKNNTLACVYVSNDLYNQVNYGWDWTNNDTNQTAIKTTPKSAVRGITKDRQDYSTKQFNCPQKSGEISYLLNIRLNPFSEYTITIPASLKDGYGNILNKDYSYKVKSGNVKDSDKYIYSSFSKQINVIPSEVDTIINIQSININKVNVNVYEVDTAGYYDYLSNGYTTGYQIKNTKNYSKELTLKNKFWDISNNKFDIEKDIVGGKISSPIYIIKGTIPDPDKLNNGKEFSNVVIKSNLSLTYESAGNKNLIFASSLDGKDTPSNLEFEGFNASGNSIKSTGTIKAKWDENKKVYELPSSYTVLVAKSDKYYGIINTNSDQTSNYDFKYIAGQDSSNKDFLYLYTERPLYRPGDTVFFKGILRQFNFEGYKKSNSKTAKLKILTENYVFFKELDIKLDENSNFSGKFELPKDMNLGKYKFEFYESGKQDSTYNDGQFFVEEYKKPVFKININSDKKDTVIGDSIKIKFDSEYYFGGRLAGAHYSKSVLSQNYYFDAKDYSDYQFGNSGDAYNCLYWGYCSYSDNIEFSKEGDMNASGLEEWNYTFPKETQDENKNNLGEKIYTFNVTITDPDTKKQVSNSYEAILHNTDAYVGIKAPYYSVQKDGIKLSGIVLNSQVQPLKNKKIKLELIKREWKNVKKQGVDGIFYNDYTVEEISEGTFDMTSDSKGEFGDNLITKSTGEYEVRATYTGENNKSFISSTNVYIGGEEAYYWGEGNNTTTDLVADKNLLKVGEKAGFTLKSPVSSGKIFVSVEKDDGILDYFTQDIHSTGERIEIPIKDTYYPNIYVKVFLIGKSGANPLPIYKRALSVIKVVTEYKNIKVRITPAKNNYLPGEKVNLKILTTDGDGKVVPYANGSVSIVDESLLALKGNPKKNPYTFFYDMKRYLGVETYLSLFNLIEKLEIKDISDGEKGGAGEGAKGGDSKKKRGVFKDTAFWQADYTTDKSGEITLTTDTLPDNLTTWVIESVASTPLDTKIGVGEATITTTKKVIINENIPRFLGSNDSITLSPVVFNKTGKNSTFTVSLNATNLEIENPTQEIKINNGEQKTVNFKVKVKDIGVAKSANELSSKLTFKAVSFETKDEDEIEKFLTIEETSTLETVSTIGSTSSVSHTEKLDLTNVIISSAKLIINYAPTILSNITSGIDYLANFPYGCIEQKQSAILPNIYIKKLYTSVELPFDLTKKMVKVWVDSDTGYKEISEDEVIKNYIAESPRFQKTSGGFGYWSDEMSYSPANFNLTSIIVSGMSEIKSIGFALNDKSQTSAVNYLKTRFYANKIEGCITPGEYNNYCKYEEAERLGAISAILTKDPSDYEAYKMYKLIDTKNDELSFKINELSVISKLLNNKNISDKDKTTLKTEAISLTNKVIGEYIVYNPRGAFLGKDSFNSRILNTSEFIGAVSDIGLDNFKDVGQIIDNMNRWIISQKKDGSFGSTQETIQVIKNMTKYIISSGELKNLNSNIKISLNGEIIDEKDINDKNKLDTYMKAISGDKVNAGGRENALGYKLKVQNDFTINKSGNGKVYYDLALSYYLPIEKVQSRDEGFYLEQTYFDYNEFRKIETLKSKEWLSYNSGAIDYKDLKYPKNVVEYLTPIKEFKVGQIVLVYNKVVTSEPRDQVAFEGYIPSGSELVNTNLDTESQSLKFSSIFSREEFRDDRYFGYTGTLDSGLFEFNYVLRMTHAGSFNLKPSQISEFYKSEVFGRNEGKLIEVK
ncbi:MAG: MG2 domain-containing protein [Candidatus Gracilibacteria bacterium]|nr:MG2 domain-containing protein [Candidatus Gracilibacteria bacterium]